MWTLCMCLCVSVLVCVCTFSKEVKPVLFVVTFHMTFMIVFHSIDVVYVEVVYVFVCVCVCVCLCVSVLVCVCAPSQKK